MASRLGTVALATFFSSTVFSACASSSDPNPAGAAGSAASGAAAGGALGSAGVAGAAAGSAGLGGAIAGAASGAAGSAGQASSGAGGAAAGSGGAGGSAAGSGGAGGQTPLPNALETLPVAADGQTVTGKVMLTMGDLFLLKATGAVDAGGTAVDAEYGGFAAGTPGQDLVAQGDVGVDVGFQLERAPKGTTPGRKKWFGAYRGDHSYYVIVTGNGAPLSLKLLRPAGTTGSGSIAVSLLRLSPAAAGLAAPLETVMANVTKPTVRSTTSTTQAVVYLLQASGEGKVGGANLALGDADWMDYTAEGVGKVDIGDEDVDYGLGVDEADPKVTPRQHWWGPFRKDHSYFMLFSGTGSSIGFSYYDVGDYGDNSKTEKIAVKIFPVP